MDDVAAILGALACADNADDVTGLKVDVAELEYYGWSIGACEEAFRVSHLTID